MNAVVMSWETVQSQSGLLEGIYSVDQVKEGPKSRGPHLPSLQVPGKTPLRDQVSESSPNLLPVIFVTPGLYFQAPTWGLKCSWEKEIPLVGLHRKPCSGDANSLHNQCPIVPSAPGTGRGWLWPLGLITRRWKVAVTDRVCVCLCVHTCVCICVPEGMWLPVWRTYDKNAFWKVWWGRKSKGKKKKSEGKGKEAWNQIFIYLLYFSHKHQGNTKASVSNWKVSWLWKAGAPSLQNPSCFLWALQWFSTYSSRTSQTSNLTQTSTQQKTEDQQNSKLELFGDA